VVLTSVFFGWSERVYFSVGLNKFIVGWFKQV